MIIPQLSPAARRGPPPSCHSVSSRPSPSRRASWMTSTTTQRRTGRILRLFRDSGCRRKRAGNSGSSNRRPTGRFFREPADIGGLRVDRGSDDRFPRRLDRGRSEGLVRGSRVHPNHWRRRPGNPRRLWLRHSTTDVLITKGINKYFYNENPDVPVKNDNVTLSLTMSVRGGNVLPARQGARQGCGRRGHFRPDRDRHPSRRRDAHWPRRSGGALHHERFFHSVSLPGL